MEIFKVIIKYIAFGAVGITLFEAYLSVNKLWKRKHEKVVAESISISAVFIGLFSGLFYSVDLLLNRAWPSLVDQIVWLLFAAFQLFVAIGFFVVGGRNTNIFKLIIKAFKQDKKEVGDLAKAFLRPSGAKYIIEILTYLATIDEQLDKVEKEYIEKFAKDWKITIDWNKVIAQLDRAKISNLSDMRKLMNKYLDTYPPKEQVSQLMTVMYELAKLDDDFSENEQLILDELDGLKRNYFNEGEEASFFYISLVPQDEAEEVSIIELYPKLEKRKQPSGHLIFLDGPYYSSKYAITMSEKYRNIKLYCAVIEDKYNKEVL